MSEPHQQSSNSLHSVDSRWYNKIWWVALERKEICIVERAKNTPQLVLYWSSSHAIVFYLVIIRFLSSISLIYRTTSSFIIFFSPYAVVDFFFIHTKKEIFFRTSFRELYSPSLFIGYEYEIINTSGIIKIFVLFSLTALKFIRFKVN